MVRLRRFLGRVRRRFELHRSRRVVRRKLGPERYDRLSKLNVVCFPDYIPAVESVGSYGYNLQKVFACLDIAPRPFAAMTAPDLIVDWQDLTKNLVDTAPFVAEALAYFGHPAPPVINGNCRDISKQHIGEAFAEVFGYDLNVDPAQYQGMAVKKSDANAAHDGEIVACPVHGDDIEQGYVYTQLIDNVEDDAALDLRMIYVHGILDFFFLKRRPEATRFDNRNTSIALCETKDYFSASELSMVQSYCQRLGLDFGELDVLRDKTTGRIFVVDVAKTPFGGLDGLGYTDRRTAMEELSVAFAERVLLPLMDPQSNP